MRKLLVLFSVLAFAAVSYADGSFTGTWKLNVAKSHFAPGPTAPKEETVTVSESAGTRDVVSKATDTSGKVTTAHFTHSLSGGPISFIEGGPTDGTTSSAKVSATTVYETSVKDGKAVGTERITLSPDGKTMRIVAKSTSPDGKPLTEVFIFEKQ